MKHCTTCTCVEEFPSANEAVISAFSIPEYEASAYDAPLFSIPAYNAPAYWGD